MAVFLGIDIGTSGAKTLAMQEDGTILASATAEYPLMSPRPGWSEQDPEDWWDATVATVKKVLKAGKIKPDDVAGIGLTGQMHGSVFLDKQHNVIRHALLWNDQHFSIGVVKTPRHGLICSVNMNSQRPSRCAS